jgi:hypothetical protein
MKRSRRRVPGESSWTDEERAVLDRLSSPELIQVFLDETAYNTDPFYRAPRAVLRDRRAHCFDGAVFAAAALRRIGHPPLLLDMRAVRDDDHVIAVFRRGGRFGAVAKSNMVGLRYREPIHRDLRELVMSYFNDYYNLEGEKTLRSFSDLVDLRRFDARNWMFDDRIMEPISQRLDDTRHRELMTPAMIRALAPVDKRTYDAGLLGSDPAGLYQVKKPA